jgi:hypothetical protein
LLPGGPGCLVLVTSRDTLGGLIARDGAHHLTLDVLSQDEAQDLLVRVLGQRADAEPAATAELARRCALLPMALRIAAANLAIDPGRSVAYQVAALSTGNRLGALAVADDEQSAVRAAFALSYTALPPAARRMFRLLGLVPGPDVTVAAAAAPARIAVGDASALLDRLAGAHLLARSPAGRFAFHDLLRRYANELAHDEETADELGAALTRLHDWYLNTSDAAARLLYPGKARLPRALPPAPPMAGFDSHADAVRWLEAERPNLLAAITDAAEPGRAPWRYVPSQRPGPAAMARAGPTHRTGRQCGAGSRAARCRSPLAGRVTGDLERARLREPMSVPSQVVDA